MGIGLSNQLRTWIKKKKSDEQLLLSLNASLSLSIPLGWNIFLILSLDMGTPGSQTLGSNQITPQAFLCLQFADGISWDLLTSPTI